MADTQSRKYQLTINNPKDKQLDHDALKGRFARRSALACWPFCVGIGMKADTLLRWVFGGAVTGRLTDTSAVRHNDCKDILHSRKNQILRR